MGSSSSHLQLIRNGKTMTILAVDMDLAKKVFALDGVNEPASPHYSSQRCHAPN